jgi:hypothetical protein
MTQTGHASIDVTVRYYGRRIQARDLLSGRVYGTVTPDGRLMFSRIGRNLVMAQYTRGEFLG